MCPAEYVSETDDNRRNLCFITFYSEFTVYSQYFLQSNISVSIVKITSINWLVVRVRVIAITFQYGYLIITPIHKFNGSEKQLLHIRVRPSIYYLNQRRQWCRRSHMTCHVRAAQPVLSIASVHSVLVAFIFRLLL